MCGAFRLPWLVTLSLVFAASIKSTVAESKATQFPQATIRALNYKDGVTELTPGRRFSLTITLDSSADYPEAGRYALPVLFYLVPAQDLESVTTESLTQSALYLGSSSIRSPRFGSSEHDLTLEVSEQLLNHEGSYNVIAWIDPESKRTAPGTQKLFKSTISVTLSDKDYGIAALEVSNIHLDTGAVIDGEHQIVGGSLDITTYTSGIERPRISFCRVVSEIECNPVRAWNSDTQSYAGDFSINALSKNETVTTLFQLEIPADLATENLTLKAVVQDPGGIAREGSADFSLTKYTAISKDFYGDTDFAREAKLKVDLARARVKNGRRSGKSLDPLSLFKLKKSQRRAIDLATVLSTITRNAKLQIKKVQEDTGTPPSGLSSSIPGSRFNMPDRDFPWLQGIEVRADPPPQRYSGSGFPNIAEYKRCIPFFCGPNSPSEAGTAPSESCIRRFCGTTFEDLRFGGRNSNLLDEQVGFDKSFSSSGFGARVGVSGQAKVYHDKAISDYVAASYETNAFFGVKIFDYSIPIFEIGSQSVYSPTEIGDSMSRNLLKILGKVVEKRESKSNGLSVGFSQFFGTKKKAEVGLGPIDVGISVEAGGRGGLSLAIEQIDPLRGIIGSVTPGVSIGAAAEATTDVGIGEFGIEGTLTLVEDTLPVTATFNAGLDISKKAVKPRLNLNITNVLEGPKGKIELILRVGISPLDVTYSTTIASFSTGSFRNTIYNKDTLFGELSYR